MAKVIKIGLFSNGYGAGKSTAALHIEGVLRKNLTGRCAISRNSLAAPIKEMLIKMDILTLPQVCNHELKNKIIPELNATPRKLMQTLGDWGRAIDPDFWGKMLDRRYAGATAPTVVIIDDVRYLNEANRCSMIYEIPRWDGSPPPADTHASEGQLKLLRNGMTCCGVLRPADYEQLTADVERALTN